MAPLIPPSPRRTVLALTSVLFALVTTAQHQRPELPAPSANKPYATGDAQRSSVQTALRSGQVSNATITTNWANKVVRMSARNHGLPEVNAIKDAKLAAKLASAMPGAIVPEAAPKSVVPAVGTNFEANWSTQQTPPDNSMAISNGGWIVSTNNDGIVYAQTSGNIPYGAFWADFFQGQGLPANIYDPKVIYDSQADRFFMVVLHGSDASNSILLWCFSQTNNPNDGWNIYQITGNPLQNNCWFDYPNIGVSNNEVYVSGNLFTSGNNQFDQAVVFQIQKSQGYSGGNLNWQYWYGLTADIGAFTVVPASWGQSGNYGPGILFVSNSSSGDNRYILWDLTNDLGANPTLNAYTVNVATYSPAADAQMPNNGDLLDNGDCRILGTFYLDGKVHCIHHADVGNGWNGLVYSRIDIANLQATQSTFGNPGVIDISYPQLTSYATSTTDPSVMVAFLRSSTSVFPEARVVNCDASMQWSNSTLVKAGETYVDFISGEDRWGDYTGMARKHNAPDPEVWMAACYGANVSGVLNNTWKTWIAQIGDGPASTAEVTDGTANTRVFPSPTVDLFNLAFVANERAVHTITLTDMKGALVKLLYEGIPAVGENMLSFNREQLAPGQYLLTISTTNKTIAHEKLVIE
ncbi:MAG: T9SS type A sorting domain-containing protein [Flavobacteriales bacterium]|nr:T9SS type A sorting domain-containing protein [Flavobacteriales bacterium]